ncbi:outer membrane protein assembly factor [Glaciecola sp. SC05]|uniref:outer membrane protein assembly factor n=1 Tax=Glaciecola sp. SC05 TaxID=1987355 RepID=UPI003527A085
MKTASLNNMLFILLYTCLASASLATEIQDGEETGNPLSNSSLANCQSTHNSEAIFKIDSITINTQPIFDEDAPDAITLHKWANALHVITKPFVIAERLPFDEGDEVTPADIVEAEALLRRERYIANADIRAEFNCASSRVNLHATTYDNWSFIPSLSFSRSGGENSTIVGVREDNLLGLGIRSTFRYRQDEQRSGYQFAMRSAFPWVRHSNVSLALADNDDGELYSFAFDKPFYHLGSTYSILAFVQSNNRIEDIFQNGDTRNSLSVDELNLRAAYGIQINANNEQTQRLIMGVDRERIEFAAGLDSVTQQGEFFDRLAIISALGLNENSLAFVPQSRDFIYPWIGYEFVQRDIHVMQDIYFIRQPEDINLGWEFYVQVGVELNSDAAGIGTHTQFRLRKGAFLGEALLLASVDLQSILNTDIKNFARIDGQLEYFYRASPLLGYYARLSGTASENQFRDRPIVIDDDNGVRGYPLQYQHGDNRFSASLETRFYTGYNFYQLFELGFAAFADVGRASGGEFSSLNEDGDILASAGFGARLYSNKASNPGVVHLDIAMPLGDGESVNSWEWSIQLRRGF